VISGWLIKVVLGIVVVGFLVVELGSPLIAKAQAQDAADEIATEVGFQLRNRFTQETLIKTCTEEAERHSVTVDVDAGDCAFDRDKNEVVIRVHKTARSLVLKNLGGMLAVNDTFKLFDATTYSGSFSSVVSQTPGQTVTWDTSNLAVNGTVRVATAVAVPVTLASVVNGNNLNLSWPANQLGWRLEIQTNSLAVGINTNWFTVPGSTSVTSASIPVVPGNPTVFLRLVFP